MAYTKEKSLPKFQLADEGVEDAFTLWGEYGKPAPLDTEGRPYQFPIKTGQLKATNGQYFQMNDIKFMKKDTFKELFPGLQKNIKYVRNILIDNVPSKYSFGTMSNEQINQIIANAKSMGQNPLSLILSQKFNPTASPRDMYKVVVLGQSAGTPQVVQGNLLQDIKPVQILMESEKAFLATVKAFPSKLDAVVFNKIAEGNKISPIRAAELFKIYSQ